MSLSLMQLNIEGGVKLDEVISYIKKNSFDIVQLQEVTGGSYSKHLNQDVFAILKQELPEYKGLILERFTQEGDPQSYFGNATFFKKEFEVLDADLFRITPFRTVPKYSIDEIDVIRHLPTGALALLIKVNETSIWFVNCHLAWGPDAKDEPEKLRQAQIFKQYLDGLSGPLVITGDFNVEKDTQTTSLITGNRVNHTVLHGITNTLSPILHRAKHLFPTGLAVDFVITSQDIKTEGFMVIDEILSDHLGLRINLA